MIFSMMCAVVVSTLTQTGVSAPAVPDDAYLTWGAESSMTTPNGYISGSPGADINGDGVVDFNDVLALLNCYQGGLPCADINGDGVIDFNDILAFLNA